MPSTPTRLVASKNITKTTSLAVLARSSSSPRTSTRSAALSSRNSSPRSPCCRGRLLARCAERLQASHPQARKLRRRRRGLLCAASARFQSRTMHAKSLSRSPRRACWASEGWYDDHGRWLRALRDSRAAHSGDPRLGREEPHRRLQQLRYRRGRPRHSARQQADKEDDLVLCWREQDVCAAISRG